MLNIRGSHDRLIFNMGIPTPGKDGLYIETGPKPGFEPMMTYYGSDMERQTFVELQLKFEYLH